MAVVAVMVEVFWSFGPLAHWCFGPLVLLVVVVLLVLVALHFCGVAVVNKRKVSMLMETRVLWANSFFDLQALFPI